MIRPYKEPEYDDTVCAQCGAKLPEECDTVAVFNDYCNEYCQSAARDDLDRDQPAEFNGYHEHGPYEGNEEFP